MRNRIKTAAAATALLFAVTAQAALLDRGGGMIYDTTRNITWLADMNYARTSGHTGTGVNTDGRMTWDAATDWANNLVYGGFDDWRLPTSNPSDTTCSTNFNPGGGFPQQYSGFNCTDSELSGLFVTDLGNMANESVLNQTGDTAAQIANLALFSNVQSYFYRSGTEYAPRPSFAWDFCTACGAQGGSGKDAALYAVAVRPGDVAALVPEPATLVLVGAALLGIAATRRRKPAVPTTGSLGT